MKTLLVFAICALGSAYVTGALALPTGNLLANPGFESGLTDWTNSNAGTRGVDPAPHGGLAYVYGPSTALFTVSQDIDLIASGLTSGQIDAGNLGVEFGGWQSGWHTQTDYGQIFIYLLDASMSQIGSASLPTFYSDNTWVEQSDSTSLLAGARFIRYEFVGTRQQGSADDAYLDDAYVYVTESVTPPVGVPEPSPLLLFGLGLAGLGLARWRLARP